MALAEAAGTLDQRPAPTDELRRRILDMREGGKAWKALAADLGIAESTASYHANRVRGSARPNKKALLCRAFREWRDPDLNRGHHDFQGMRMPCGVAVRARP
jgi:hypothetical protein